MYHPDQPPNDDVPYSWSPDLPYFDFVRQECGPDGNVTKIGCGGCPAALPDEHFYDWQLANHTIQALRLAKSDGRPFFVAAGFRRPHTPWYINQRFVDMYNDTDIAPPLHSTWAINQPACAFITGGDGVGPDFNISSPRPQAEAELCRRTYYAAITSTDSYIGLVLDELAALDLEQDTAVVVFGDHGTSLAAVPQ